MPDTHNFTSSTGALGAPLAAHGHQMEQPRRTPAPAEAIPRSPLLHYAALLSGFGTAFLGPSLPALSAGLHLSDRGGGALFAAQFTGAFLGGWFTRAPLRRCMLRGFTCAAVGFAALSSTLAFHAALAWALAALLLLGFGVGQIITSNNLLASLLWAHRRGAALTLLNFTWSAGALCSPLFVPALVRASGPAPVLAGFASLLFVGLIAVFALPPAPNPLTSVTESSRAQTGLSQRTFLFFCLQLFLYGGVETSLDGWLHTYDLRYTHATHAFAASTAAFWFCLAGTRAAASALLLRLPERQFLRGGLALAVLALATLLALGPGRGNLIPVLAGITGAALAPWFPLLFSGLVSEGPTAPQAGRIVAVSGLGAAAIPWLVGQISAGTGSLRTALLLPIAGVLFLLLLSFRRRSRELAAEEIPSQIKSGAGV
ncbi:MFS transporter [Terriglobus aquaticus]|uniref:MFS transporter n=1 Tax=Terriglobus aquaticus TaxID=940139 RepID=A0ABW9KLQ8_9BACT|nr:MFS transporter [Terriglobus aquaticus]